MQTVYRHVVLGDEGGQLELVPPHHGVEELHARQRVHLRLDGRRHERREPPRHHLSPKCGVNNVKRFEVLLVFVRQHGVDLLEPGEGRVVAAGRQRVEVRDHVVAVHDRVQQLDQVQESLIQVDIPNREPLPDEHDDGAAEAVHAALVQAADARHLAQVLRVSAPE